MIVVGAAVEAVAVEMVAVAAHASPATVDIFGGGGVTPRMTI